MNKSLNENRKHPCPICLKRFKARNHLQEHMLLHSDKTNYKCEKCQIEFRAPGSWRNHMRKAHGFECPQCSKTFSTLTLLKQHRVSKHKGYTKQKLEDEVGIIENNERTTFTNGIKSENFSAKKTIISTPRSIVKKIIAKSRSNSNKTKTGKFVCKECGFRSKFAASLATHMFTIHKDTYKYKCTQCDYKSNRLYNLKAHSERHNDRKSLKCTVSSCNLEFLSSKNLRNHLEQFHSIGISIKNEKGDDYWVSESKGKESELWEESDAIHDDENGDLDEKVDDSFECHNNSFLNSTEKSTKLSHSVLQSKSSELMKKSRQLKISTCFSLSNSKKEAKNSTEVTTEKLKSTVSYECCECKIDFPSNSELWDHLLAVHYHKMKNNVKKSL